ncbi:phage Gp37/Gp68 family protein [Mycobacteroides abscessus]|uniref:phage Gp37/Gp68 family protein n=1 Tax=Mycobacteroides abscessus TaxID=36809 RepID=UPI0009294853|nr:phage Gp37/Gp68 family protein [Mycobacteroides abscessus]SID06748.1 bacteriophage protein gp37 [Mycobacteroides abscessus subsp. abscessus]
MGDKTGIEWTDATWNVVIGCDKVSPGCDHCYAIRTAHRMQAHPNPKVVEPYAGTESSGEWTGRVNLVTDRLALPLQWKQPRRIFVNAQSDLFHDQVPDQYIARVFAIMAVAQHHTFQILTKRHARMRSLLSSADGSFIYNALLSMFADQTLRVPAKGPLTVQVQEALNRNAFGQGWPLPNVWLGVSAEDQKRADLRIPALLDTPAAVRWISAEPLLGPVNLHTDPIKAGTPFWGSQLDWVVVGGESGSGARPMHPWWAESLHRQCVAAGVPFLFKQWGDWTPMAPLKKGRFDFSGIAMTDDGNTYNAGDLDWPDGPRRGEAMRADFPHHHPTSMYRVGKKAAGRELYHDGRTFDEYPGVVTE